MHLSKQFGWVKVNRLVSPLLPFSNWSALRLEQHESWRECRAAEFDNIMHFADFPEPQMKWSKTGSVFSGGRWADQWEERQTNTGVKSSKMLPERASTAKRGLVLLHDRRYFSVEAAQSVEEELFTQCGVPFGFTQYPNGKWANL